MSHPSLSTFQQSTKAILDHLHLEFTKLQTGRANAAVVEHISVEAYGQRMAVKALASISVQDAKSMMVQPWDKSVLGAIEKAISQSNLGVSPVNDGIAIRLNFPPMTEERRKHLAKVVKELSEQAKIRVRQDRQVANDAIKGIADENEKERDQKELQKFVDETNAKIDEAAKRKEVEVMTV